MDKRKAPKLEWIGGSDKDIYNFSPESLSNVHFSITSSLFVQNKSPESVHFDPSPFRTYIHTQTLTQTHCSSAPPSSNYTIAVANVLVVILSVLVVCLSSMLVQGLDYRYDTLQVLEEFVAGPTPELDRRAQILWTVAIVLLDMIFFALMVIDGVLRFLGPCTVFFGFVYLVILGVIMTVKITDAIVGHVEDLFDWVLVGIEDLVDRGKRRLGV